MFPAKGTQGTVTGVDDIGSILIQWDNGSTLNAVYGEDVVRIVKPDFELVFQMADEKDLKPSTMLGNM